MARAARLPGATTRHGTPTGRGATTRRSPREVTGKRRHRRRFVRRLLTRRRQFTRTNENEFKEEATGTYGDSLRRTVTRTRPRSVSGVCEERRRDHITGATPPSMN